MTIAVSIVVSVVAASCSSMTTAVSAAKVFETSVPCARMVLAPVIINVTQELLSSRPSSDDPTGVIANATDHLVNERREEGTLRIVNCSLTQPVSLLVRSMTSFAGDAILLFLKQTISLEGVTVSGAGGVTLTPDQTGNSGAVSDVHVSLINSVVNITNGGHFLSWISSAVSDSYENVSLSVANSTVSLTDRETGRPMSVLCIVPLAVTSPNATFLRMTAVQHSIVRSHVTISASPRGGSVCALGVSPPSTGGLRGLTLTNVSIVGDHSTVAVDAKGADTAAALGYYATGEVQATGLYMRVFRCQLVTTGSTRGSTSLGIVGSGVTIRLAAVNVDRESNVSSTGQWLVTSAGIAVTGQLDLAVELDDVTLNVSGGSTVFSQGAYVIASLGVAMLSHYYGGSCTATNAIFSVAEGSSVTSAGNTAVSSMGFSLTTGTGATIRVTNATLLSENSSMIHAEGFRVVSSMGWASWGKASSLSLSDVRIAVLSNSTVNGRATGDVLGNLGVAHFGDAANVTITRVTWLVHGGSIVHGVGGDRSTACVGVAVTVASTSPPSWVSLSAVEVVMDAMVAFGTGDNAVAVGGVATVGVSMLTIENVIVCAIASNVANSGGRFATAALGFAASNSNEFSISVLNVSISIVDGSSSAAIGTVAVASAGVASYSFYSHTNLIASHWAVHIRDSSVTVGGTYAAARAAVGVASAASLNNTVSLSDDVSFTVQASNVTANGTRAVAAVALSLTSANRIAAAVSNAKIAILGRSCVTSDGGDAGESTCSGGICITSRDGELNVSQVEIVIASGSQLAATGSTAVASAGVSIQMSQSTGAAMYRFVTLSAMKGSHAIAVGRTSVAALGLVNGGCTFTSVIDVLLAAEGAVISCRGRRGAASGGIVSTGSGYLVELNVSRAVMGFESCMVTSAATDRAAVSIGVSLTSEYFEGRLLVADSTMTALRSSIVCEGGGSALACVGVALMGGVPSASTARQLVVTVYESMISSLGSWAVAAVGVTSQSGQFVNQTVDAVLIRVSNSNVTSTGLHAVIAVGVALRSLSAYLGGQLMIANSAFLVKLVHLNSSGEVGVGCAAVVLSATRSYTTDLRNMTIVAIDSAMVSDGASTIAVVAVTVVSHRLVVLNASLVATGSTLRASGRDLTGILSVVVWSGMLDMVAETANVTLAALRQCHVSTTGATVAGSLAVGFYVIGQYHLRVQLRDITIIAIDGSIVECAGDTAVGALAVVGVAGRDSRFELLRFRAVAADGTNVTIGRGTRTVASLGAAVYGEQCVLSGTDIVLLVDNRSHVNVTCMPGGEQCYVMSLGARNWALAQVNAVNTIVAVLRESSVSLSGELAANYAHFLSVAPPATAEAAAALTVRRDNTVILCASTVTSDIRSMALGPSPSLGATTTNASIVMVRATVRGKGANCFRGVPPSPLPGAPPSSSFAFATFSNCSTVGWGGSLVAPPGEPAAPLATGGGGKGIPLGTARDVLVDGKLVQPADVDAAGSASFPFPGFVAPPTGSGTEDIVVTTLLGNISMTTREGGGQPVLHCPSIELPARDDLVRLLEWTEGMLRSTRRAGSSLTHSLSLAASFSPSLPAASSIFSRTRSLPPGVGAASPFSPSSPAATPPISSAFPPFWTTELNRSENLPPSASTPAATPTLARSNSTLVDVTVTAFTSGKNDSSSSSQPSVDVLLPSGMNAQLRSTTAGAGIATALAAAAGNPVGASAASKATQLGRTTLLVNCGTAGGDAIAVDDVSFVWARDGAWRPSAAIALWSTSAGIAVTGAAAVAVGERWRAASGLFTAVLVYYGANAAGLAARVLSGATEGAGAAAGVALVVAVGAAGLSAVGVIARWNGGAGRWAGAVRYLVEGAGTSPVPRCCARTAWSTWARA